jgi:hypothetical protein
MTTKLGTIRIIKEDRPINEGGLFRCIKSILFERGQLVYGVSPSKDWEPVQAIVTCNDKPNKGDKIIDLRPLFFGEIHTFDHKEENDQEFFITNNGILLHRDQFEKVLVLSSQISPETIQFLITKKLNDGDQAEVNMIATNDPNGISFKKWNGEYVVTINNGFAIINSPLPSINESFDKIEIDYSQVNKESIEESACKFIGLSISKEMDEEKRYFNQRSKEYDAFIAGSKEQAKRMYGEEDMKKAYEEGCRVASPFGHQGLSKFEKENWTHWWNLNKKQ